jgi:pimeloyl-ACP methyl ester carboxylesterase
MLVIQRRSTALLLLAAGSLLTTGCLTRHVIGDHPEWKRLVASPEDFGLEAERVQFKSTEGLKLAAWWLPAKGESKASVVLAHGLGGNRSVMLGRAKFLVEAGYDVLAVDLRAHGESDGRYVTPGFKEAEDLLNAAAYLLERNPGRPLVLFGHSYGAVAVLHATARTSPAKAAVADAPFMSQADVMRRFVAYVRNDPKAPLAAKIFIGVVRWPGVRWLMGVEFYLRTGVNVNRREVDAITVVPRIKKTPVLFIAGQTDPISPAANVQRLFDAAPCPGKRIVVLPATDHQTYSPSSKELYERTVLEFLESLP